MNSKSPKPDPICALLTMAEAPFVMMLSEEAVSGELVDQGDLILTACDVEGINKAIPKYYSSTVLSVTNRPDNQKLKSKFHNPGDTK